MVMVNVILDMLSPLLTSTLTDELVSDNVRLSFIINISILAFVIVVISQTFLYIESKILQNCGQRIIFRLRNEIFRHIENMSLNQFAQMPVGSLVTRVTSYTASMSDLFTGVFVRILKDITTLIGVYVVMFVISPSLSLVKNNEIYKQTRNVIKGFGIFRPLVSTIYNLSVALSFTLGVIFHLTAGEIVAFYLFLSRFFNPIQDLADQLNALQKAFTASERIFNLLDVKPDVLDSEDALEIDNFKGHIEFKNVWFAYEGEDWILKDVSFEIEPKTTCAFVGATGAGKTTILQLIVRNYEVQKGEILIDGININKIKISSLRRAIGQMLQDVFLFSGSIASNITLHDDRFSDDDIKEACKYVNANSFIDKLPNGINEEIIEKGENLSQGQRQLLSFARTVIHKPQVLILDEATANIDTETEVLIQASLEKMKNIGTMLVVAHRLSTIQHADQIIVLQHGEIIERGNHQELLHKHGYYYKLYQLQFEG